MSTRCQIKVIYPYNEYGYVKTALIYHHHDGYPQGVGYDLIHRQNKIGTWSGACIVNELLKDANDEYKFDFIVHTDIDYWYEIDCGKKTIRCWRVKGYEVSDHAEVVKGEEVIMNFNIKEAKND